MSNFKKGQRVAIINQSYSGKFVFEGWAHVIGLGPVGTDQHRVQFERGPRQIVERFIDPLAQANPEEHAKHLNEACTPSPGSPGDALSRVQSD